MKNLKWALVALVFVVCPPFLSAEETPPAKSDSKSASAEKPWLVESARIGDDMPKPTRQRMLWAKSVQFQTIREILNGPIEVDAWVNEPPKDLAGKFVLVEVWATWCSPCRRSLPLLEYYHEKYKDDLVVISICEEGVEALKKLEGPLKMDDLKAPLAVDPHRRFANALGVYGIPHAVLIEPIQGAVLWEGMPTQIGYELSDERLGKILANRKRLAEAGKLPETAPFEFKVCPPDPDKPNLRPGDRLRSAGDEDEVAPEG